LRGPLHIKGVHDTHRATMVTSATTPLAPADAALATEERAAAEDVDLAADDDDDEDEGGEEEGGDASGECALFLFALLLNIIAAGERSARKPNQF
jgi:hypothetical protein